MLFSRNCWLSKCYTEEEENNITSKQISVLSYAEDVGVIQLTGGSLTLCFSNQQWPLTKIKGKNNLRILFQDYSDVQMLFCQTN